MSMMRVTQESGAFDEINESFGPKNNNDDNKFLLLIMFWELSVNSSVNFGIIYEKVVKISQILERWR